MTLDHPQALGVQLGSIRKILAVKEPVGVVVQFMPALVLGIQRREKCARITCVNQDRAMVSAAKLPERVDPRIIDADQPATAVAMAQAEGLVDLQPLGASLETRLQPLELAIGPARLVDALEC